MNIPKDKLLAEVDSWCAALSGAKLFTKKLKEYLKQRKFVKLKGLHPYMGAFVSFLKAQSLKIHNSMLLVHLKVEFACSGGDIWSDGLKLLIKLGLDDVVQAVPSDADTSGESWLRASLLTRIADDIQSMEVQTCEAMRPKLRKAVGCMVADLKTLKCASVLQELIADLEALDVMFMAGLDCTQVSASTAAAAAEDFKHIRFTLLHSALQKSPAGLEFMSGLTDLLRRGAEDELGD